MCSSDGRELNNKDVNEGAVEELADNKKTWGCREWLIKKKLILCLKSTDESLRARAVAVQKGQQCACHSLCTRRNSRLYGQAVCRPTVQMQVINLALSLSYTILYSLIKNQATKITRHNSRRLPLSTRHRHRRNGLFVFRSMNRETMKAIVERTRESRRSKSAQD